MILLTGTSMAGSVIKVVNINNMVSSSDTPSSFAAIENADAEILILGSVPSVESLKQQHYYAHPRNVFWRIMKGLFSFADELSYSQRCTRLIKHKIAVWDVLQSCQRQGSLDSNIVASSIITNNFTHFLQQHQKIRLIVFNGAKAEHIFNQYVLATLTDTQLAIVRKRLPSTSPAHA
ncbi:DNA-deoxyinosine glycosylase, partial [Pseudomonadota bacterium]|nr:DNA-deoxyinosine glycosylase [Pseudomonadota bacterium]